MMWISNIRLLLALLTGSLFGCAIVSNEETTTQEQAGAFYFTSCSPVDGPAFEVIIPSEPASCKDLEFINYSQPWAQSFTRIYIYQSLSDEPNTIYRFGEDVEFGLGYSSGGWAGRCEQSETSCVVARSGTFRLVYPPRGYPQAEIDILFEDGTRFNARLKLIECAREQPLLCG